MLEVSTSARNSLCDGLPDTRRDRTSRFCIPCATVAVPRDSNTHFHSLLLSSSVVQRYRCAGSDDIAGIGPFSHAIGTRDYVDAKSEHLVCCPVRPLTRASMNSVFVLRVIAWNLFRVHAPKTYSSSSGRAWSPLCSPTYVWPWLDCPYRIAPSAQPFLAGTLLVRVRFRLSRCLAHGAVTSAI